MENKNKKVLVALSGGVDSSVALLLLREQGYEVIGATMKLWDFSEVGGDVHKDGRCCSLDSINDAREVCDLIGVPHYLLNFTELFKKTVIENFVSEYLNGRTPNPCVLCNTEIKWEQFLAQAEKLDCDYIATGHYARTGIDKKNGRGYLKRAIDGTRDQAYALWGIDQEALKKTIFPLGEITKKETRVLAEKAGLKTAKTPESMEICFVSDDNYGRFIRQWSGQEIPEGDIVNQKGETVGHHKGLPFYTVGQRKGLGISHPTPLYVTKIDTKNNRIEIGDKEDVKKNNLVISAVNWVSAPPTSEPFNALVQIRYLHKSSAARVTPLETGKIKIEFETSQLAITPGQTAVIFDGDTVMAGGIID